MQTKCHSPRMFSIPRIKNCRKPRACLIWPKIGSIIPFRLAYVSWPFFVRSLRAILCLAVKSFGIWSFGALWSKGNLLVVFQPLGGNVRIDLLALQIGHVLSAEVTGVGVENADLLIHAGGSKILLGLLDRRNNLTAKPLCGRLSLASGVTSAAMMICFSLATACALPH